VIWPVFLAALWLALGLDVALREPLQLGPNAAPSLTMILVAFVAMWGPRLHAVYAAVCAGVALDLLSAKVAPGGTSAVTTLGPHALGATLGAFTVLTSRAMVERSNPLALPVMAATLTALTHLVVVFCYAVKGLYDPAISFSAGPELASRGVTALYTGLAALPVGLMLRPTARLFGFSGQHGRRVRVW